MGSLPVDTVPSGSRTDVAFQAASATPSVAATDVGSVKDSASLQACDRKRSFPCRTATTPAEVFSADFSSN